MAVCANYGIPHSQFLGWSVDDRDKALWWEIHRRESCSECGTRADEWDPELGGHDYAYLPELRKCWGCARTAEAQKRVKDGDANKGVRVVLVRNPEAR